MTRPEFVGRPFRFWFVRHGVTEPNARGVRCGGDLDVPLLDAGCDQALEVGKRLRRSGPQIDLIIAADLVRTRQMALIVSGVLGGLPVVIEPGFNERRLGGWNNRSIAETEPLLRSGVAPPGGETEAAFSDRVTRALDAATPHLRRRALVVGSKGVARVLNLVLGGTDRLDLPNGELVEFAGEPLGTGIEYSVRRVQAV